MPRPIKDLTGQRFGKLTVISCAGRIINGQQKCDTYWNCVCECGNTKMVRRDKLVNDITHSCGCIKTGRKDKHGSSHTRLYKIYDHILQICFNPHHRHYKDYGGRGITVCPEWYDKGTGFITFKKWSLENGYNETLSIDRIDVNGNYEPNNCRWTDTKTQANNTRKTIFLEYKGEKVSLTLLAEKLNIPRYIFYERYKSGWSNDDIIYTPINMKFSNRRKKAN